MTRHYGGQTHLPVRQQNGKNSPFRDRRQYYPTTIKEHHERVYSDNDIERTIKVIRVRHMSYRTEESYIGWLRRWDAFYPTRFLHEFEEQDLKEFLEYLAVEQYVSASTQRQALNAGVFYLREVRKLELGDFSDYVRANKHKYYPVVYAKEEIAALFKHLTRAASRLRPTRRAFPNDQTRIFCATPSPPTCWRTGWISGRCRISWGTRESKRPRFTSTS